MIKYDILKIGGLSTCVIFIVILLIGANIFTTDDIVVLFLMWLIGMIILFVMDELMLGREDE